MWLIKPTDEYIKRCKNWPKKHSRELKAVHNNLDTFLKALVLGAHPQNAKFGFIHPEPGGVLAIDQKGGGGGLKQTRLYVYPESPSQLLHLITIGDKDTQQNDIETTKCFVKEISLDQESSIQHKGNHGHPNHGPKAAVLFQRKRNVRV